MSQLSVIQHGRNHPRGEGQISAIAAALERVSKIELKNHFEHCYADAIRSGDDARAHAEISDLLGLTKLSR